MRHSKFALDVGVFIVLSETALVQGTRCHLLSQASLDDIQFANLLLHLIVLVSQIVTFILQISLHVRHIVISILIGGFAT